MTQETKIYVGNLAYSVTEEQLADHFQHFGNILELSLIKDRETGRSKGFAFINYETSDEAQKSLSANGDDLMGRSIIVNIARDKKRTGGGGNGRGPRGGGRGGRSQGGFRD